MTLRTTCVNCHRPTARRAEVDGVEYLVCTRACEEELARPLPQPVPHMQAAPATVPPPRTCAAGCRWADQACLCTNPVEGERAEAVRAWWRWADVVECAWRVLEGAPPCPGFEIPPRAGAAPAKASARPVPTRPDVSPGQTSLFG